MAVTRACKKTRIVFALLVIITLGIALLSTTALADEGDGTPVAQGAVQDTALAEPSNADGEGACIPAAGEAVDQGSAAGGIISGDAVAGGTEGPASESAVLPNDNEELDLAGFGIEEDGCQDEADPCAGDEVEVSSAADLIAVITSLNTSGGSKTVVLTEDITTNEMLNLRQGELTILGGGHTITLAASSGCIYLPGSAVLNLGEEGYESTLTISSTNNSTAIIDAEGTSTVNIYPNVTLGPSRASADAGAVSVLGQSTFNMKGGTITGCISFPVAAVYVDENGTFNMYDGQITDCDGGMGGAIVLSGGEPIGGSSDDPVSAVVHLYGGTISNCHDATHGAPSFGGGAVAICADSPVSFIMDGGTITGCNTGTEGYGFGGAIFVFNTDPNGKVELNAGTITGNTAEYGGGVFVHRGTVSVANGFSLYDNTATFGGDDIYNNGEGTDLDIPEIYYLYGYFDYDLVLDSSGIVTLGTADTSATHSCGHKVDNWYEDLEERWNSIACSGEGEDYLVVFDQTGTACSEIFGLKAAHGQPASTHAVTFDSDGGSKVEPQDVPDGGTVTRPPDPKKDGFTFDGWVDEEGQPYDFSTPVTGDLVLKATWKKNEPPTPGGSTDGQGIPRAGDDAPLGIVGMLLLVGLAAACLSPGRRRAKA